MQQLDASLAVVGALVVAVALLSNWMSRGPLQEPLTAAILGIVVGPHGIGLLDLARWGDENAILEQAARLTLAIGLMGVALRIQRESVTKFARPVVLLLTAGMIGMWLASSALLGLLLGLSLWPALLIGAAITPTDPVVASSIVSGPFAEHNLPLRIRDVLSLESGANDGLAFPFVMLPILMMQAGVASAWSDWLVDTLLIAVLGAAALGALVGYLAAVLLEAADRRGAVQRISMLGYTVAFSLFTLGAASLLSMDALISVFVAGLVFNLRACHDEEREEERIQEGVSKLFTLPMFVIFGIAAPLDAWADLGWPLAALVVLVLLLRRPPVVAALYPVLGGGLRRADAAFVGWFGPIGIAAIYYAAFARSHIGDPLAWHVVSAVAFGSILAHGVTAAPLIRLHRRAARSEGDGQ